MNRKHTKPRSGPRRKGHFADLPPPVGSERLLLTLEEGYALLWRRLDALNGHAIAIYRRLFEIEAGEPEYMWHLAPMPASEQATYIEEYLNVLAAIGNLVDRPRGASRNGGTSGERRRSR